MGPLLGVEEAKTKTGESSTKVFGGLSYFFQEEIEIDVNQLGNPGQHGASN